MITTSYSPRWPPLSMQKFSDGQVMSQVYLSCLMFPVMLGEIGQDFRGGGGGAPRMQYFEAILHLQCLMDKREFSLSFLLFHVGLPHYQYNIGQL
jgi:hypothetical protein